MLAIDLKCICSKVLRNDLPTLALESTASKVAQNVKLAMENHYAFIKNNKAIMPCPEEGCARHWVV